MRYAWLTTRVWLTSIEVDATLRGLAIALPRVFVVALLRL